jgi:hypothetical protein
VFADGIGDTRGDGVGMAIGGGVEDELFFHRSIIR